MNYQPDPEHDDETIGGLEPIQAPAADDPVIQTNETQDEPSKDETVKTEPVGPTEPNTPPSPAVDQVPRPEPADETPSPEPEPQPATAGEHADSGEGALITCPVCAHQFHTDDPRL